MPSNNSNAVAALLADAEQTLAVTLREDVRGSAKLGRRTITDAHGTYEELVRRSRSVEMTGQEKAAFQNVMDHLRASLRFFGEAV